MNNNYILGTGLSHDGSSCILKDGEIIVAIEKERLSRIKHDGGNDFSTVEYCLKAADIQIEDLSLIVQASNFEMDIRIDRYRGKRYFKSPLGIPVVTISHHLAHAWSAVGGSPFETCNVMVIDGSGSPYQQCLDRVDGHSEIKFNPGLYHEKDSFYHFDGKTLTPLFKDFSEVRLYDKAATMSLPVTYHSIGGLYNAASSYCFGNIDDTGKLMGLAPYGKLDGKPSLFKLERGIVEVNYEVISSYFTTPAQNYSDFRTNFCYYANIARWVQAEAEKAILYLFGERLRLHPHPNMAYAGGVALNAVANQRLLAESSIENLYIQPAAGDNGLALGCAWYGWFNVQGNKKKSTFSSPFLGRSYRNEEITKAIDKFESANNIKLQANQNPDYIKFTASLLSQGKIIGWFQQGAEFGPRALGHRSILADPRTRSTRDHINKNIKFREDFRPFAPAVRKELVNTYFKNGWDSPYMIMVDKIKPEYREMLSAVIHEDESSRVQTVYKDWNPEFYNLLEAFEEETGLGVLLNTSLNKKGMPIVETPLEAIELFYSGALDALIIDDYIIIK